MHYLGARRSVADQAGIEAGVVLPLENDVRHELPAVPVSNRGGLQLVCVFCSFSFENTLSFPGLQRNDVWRAAVSEPVTHRLLLWYLHLEEVSNSMNTP